MQYAVPEEHSPPPPPVAPAGRYEGTVASIDEGMMVYWTFDAEDRDWTILMSPSHVPFGDMLMDLGFSGEIDTDDVVGTKATITVRTFGGHTSAKVIAVEAIPPEEPPAS